MTNPSDIALPANIQMAEVGPAVGAIDESKIVLVTGGQPFAPHLIPDLPVFPGCGCEVGGQFGKIRCTDVECEGCTISLDNETCRHVFMHFGRIKNFDRPDGKDGRATLLEGARRRKHVQRDGTGRPRREDEADRIGLASCPDGNHVMIFLDQGPLAGLHHRDSHPQFLRDRFDTDTIAEAGGDGSAPGGGPRQ